ncbi:MAG TPA: hypothetical protein VF951_02080 [Streptosporangiaceae bacterium]
MAYDEGPATRLLDVLGDEGGLATKKMFGGLAILLVASRTPAACHRNNRRKHPRLRQGKPAEPAVRRGIQPPAVGGEEVRQARAGDRACLPCR